MRVVNRHEAKTPLSKRVDAVEGDPLDRLLVAQAREDGLKLLARDKALAPYGAWIPIV